MTSGTERLPAPDLERLTPEQQIAFDEIAAGPRGALIGPFAPLLHSPELMTRVQRTGEFLRFQATLDSRLLELSILLVAREWDQQFEWSFHRPLAERAGVSLEVIEAVGAGVRPESMPHDEEIVWDVFTELHATRTVTDETYARAEQIIGQVALVELVAALGYYTLLAMVMNVAQTAAPAEPALPARIARIS